MSYKLTYFPARGRGELIRMIFAVSGEEYVDERITQEEWQVLKPNTPMKSLPILTKDGNKVACQTGSIARFLAKKYRLFGSNPWEELLIDECTECISDMTTAAMKWFLEKDEEEKAKLKKEYGDTSIAKFVDYLRLRMKDAKNGYIVGEKLSLADIGVFNFVDAMKSFGNTWFDGHDDIMRHYDLVKSNPGLAKWLEKRPPQTQ